MMGRLNAGTKEALFVMGVLTVALVVGIAVLAVWLSGEDGAEPAAVPAETAEAPPPAPPPEPPPATEPAPPAPPPAAPPPGPAPARPAGRPGRRQGGLRARRLRVVPHARGRRWDGDDRPE